jgi:hypothetical protein
VGDRPKMGRVHAELVLADVVYVKVLEQERAIDELIGEPVRLNDVGSPVRAVVAIAIVGMPRVPNGRASPIPTARNSINRYF